MKISVAMATYNGSRFIKEQLESIRNQTLPVDEVIICDDCSTDSVVEIIEEFIASNHVDGWHLIRNKENLGYAQNFINAIKHTTGDIIFLCDQDDIWMSNKVNDMVKCFKDNPEVWMLHSAIDLIDQNGVVLDKNYHKLRSGYNILSFAQYIERLNYCGMSSAFTSALREDLDKFDLSEIPTHDWILGVIAVIDGNFAITDTVYTRRRKHDKNVALKSCKKKSSREDRIEFINLYNQFYSCICSILNKSGGNYALFVEQLNNRIEVNKKRILGLKRKSLYDHIKLIKYIKLFPDFKSYVSDVRYYFR